MNTKWKLVIKITFKSGKTVSLVWFFDTQEEAEDRREFEFGEMWDESLEGLWMILGQKHEAEWGLIHTSEIAGVVFGVYPPKEDQ